MTKKLLLTFMIITGFMISEAQWSLGDIAFTAYNADLTLPAGVNNDSFTIVLLRDVTSGEQIEFTENGWFAAGGFRVGENTCTLTFGSNYLAGTQIAISRDPFVALDQDSNSAGTLTGAGLSLATGGDQIFAYNPANVPSAGNETGFIAAMHMNGPWDFDSTSSTTSAQPSVFTDGVNSISIAPEVDNARLAPANCNNFTDIATLRTLCNTSSNWEVNNDIGYTQLPPACDFLTTLSVDQLVFENEITLYPNPVLSELNISSSVNPDKIEIFDITGKTVYEFNSNPEGPINMDQLSKGVYLVKISAGNASVVKKLVKN